MRIDAKNETNTRSRPWRLTPIGLSRDSREFHKLKGTRRERLMWSWRAGVRLLTSDNAYYEHPLIQRLTGTSNGLYYSFARGLFHGGDITQNAVECPYAKRLVVGHRQTVVSRRFRLQDNMAADLM